MHPYGVICHGFFSAYVLADPDVKKSGSTSCDIIAWCLTKLFVNHKVLLREVWLHDVICNSTTLDQRTKIILFSSLQTFLHWCSCAEASHWGSFNLDIRMRI